ncbi:MAG: cyclic nucleotide-binding domain-containing protein [Actinomycetota bacterium]|nr:cyclic nucleotide-binding domain-containing protein [Actinomycetota bacterium]
MAPGTTAGKQITQLLAQVPLFSGCTSSELETIARAGKQVAHPDGEVIAREGESGYGLHVLLEGEARVEVKGEPRRILGPGQFFGELALLDKGPRTATVVATSRLVTFVVPRWNFREILTSQPGLALKLLEEVAARFRSATATSPDDKLLD